eukprot:TRINITY_DN35571_c0_g1_i1.p1 TRINITY_DN35571_c0_g1~~TRINITY_DN35571_c0_g1_i1.p1  ORF type:complete len:404 (+),score=16.97 TRINITY_DN35571_c0_g1_i1:159-1214(+)
MHEGEGGRIFAWKGTAFHQCWVEVLIVFVFSAIITLVWAFTGRKNEEAPWSLGVDTHRLLMIPIAFLTVFRTNISFSRFWEARGHVGELTHHCRSLARRMRWVVPRRAMDNLCRLILGFNSTIQWDLHRHMRNVTREDAEAECFTRMEWEELKAHYDCMPVVVLNWIDSVVMESAQRGSLDPQGREAVQAHIDGMQTAWMGMNKITTTPIPFPYSHLIKILLFLWLITVGIAFQSETGFFTPLVVALISFALFGINQTGVELEFPFGIDLNDLPMHKFATRISLDVLSCASTTKDDIREVAQDLEYAEQDFAPKDNGNATGPASPRSPVASPTGVHAPPPDMAYSTMSVYA